MEQFEKVTKGLECCIASNDSCCPKECPYNATCFAGRIAKNVYVHLMSDALALINAQQERIKELEAAQTAKWEDPVSEGVWSWDKRAYTQCSSCKKKSYLGWKDPYCRYCGAKMLPEPPKEGTQG